MTVEKIVYVDRIVEKPVTVEKIVERIVEKPVTVTIEKIIEVPVVDKTESETITFMSQTITELQTKLQEKTQAPPVQPEAKIVYVDRIVEKPVTVEKIVERIVEKPVTVTIEKIIEVPVVDKTESETITFMSQAIKDLQNQLLFRSSSSADNSYQYQQSSSLTFNFDAHTRLMSILNNVLLKLEASSKDNTELKLIINNYESLLAEQK